MTSGKIAFDMPDELLAKLGTSDELAAEAKRAFVLDLLRDGRIGQGRAAELLGIPRSELLLLMVRYAIPSGLRTPEDVDKEVETARRIASERRRD